MYTFPVVEKSLNSIHNIEHIHPRKQRVVRDILKVIPKISVFGSATRWDCNEKSDIDILLDRNEIKLTNKEAYKILVNTINSSFDVLWLDEIKGNLNKFQQNNIIDGSIKLYER